MAKKAKGLKEPTKSLKDKKQEKIQRKLEEKQMKRRKSRTA